MSEELDKSHPHYPVTALLKDADALDRIRLGTFGEYKWAIEDYDKVLEFNPEIEDVYCNRGLAKDMLLDYSGAMADYNRALELNPNHAKAMVNRGLTKIDMGNIEEGCLDLQKGRELGNAVAYEAIKRYCK